MIADSIEVMVRAHEYDGVVGISGCDKSLPGTLMGMGRLNRPSNICLWRDYHARFMEWQAGDCSRRV